MINYGGDGLITALQRSGPEFHISVIIFTATHINQILNMNSIKYSFFLGLNRVELWNSIIVTKSKLGRQDYI